MIAHRTDFFQGDTLPARSSALENCAFHPLGGGTCRAEHVRIVAALDAGRRLIRAGQPATAQPYITAGAVYSCHQRVQHPKFKKSKQPLLKEGAA